MLEFRVLKLYGFPLCSSVHGTQPGLLSTAHISSLPILVSHHITRSHYSPPAPLFTSCTDGQLVHKRPETVLRAPSTQDRKVRIPLRTWVGLGMLGKGIPWFQEAGEIPHSPQGGISCSHWCPQNCGGTKQTCRDKVSRGRPPWSKTTVTRLTGWQSDISEKT